MKTSHKIGGGAAIVLACAFIQPWEGLWTTAQVDTIGTGRPVTWCYGETKGNVKAGQHFTPQQCSDMLAKRLPEYNAEISKCIHVPISDKTRAAFVSFAYNVGSAGFCGSSAARRLNAGDYRGACDGLLSWNRAQGRVVKGLVNRRNAERGLCLEGINAPAPKPEPVTLWTKIKLFFLSIFKGN
jgi:lysozyme